MTDHRDSLQALNDAMPLRDRLIAAHDSIKTVFPFIVRIAVAIYDEGTDTLSTYMHSTDGENPLDHYQASMASAPSLKAILEKGLPRVIKSALFFSTRIAAKCSPNGYCGR
jgi:hypothetical protein